MGFLRRRKRKITAVAYLTAPGEPHVDVPIWSFPEGLEIVSDTSPALWIEESLAGQPWATVGALVPGGFEAYARVLHPAYRSPPRQFDTPEATVSWAEVAAITGRVMHPLVQYARISGTDDRSFPNEGPEGIWRPYDGDLPSEVADPLLPILRGTTSAPERCWFCIWNGYGQLQALKNAGTHSLVRTPGREYVLLRGAIEQVTVFGVMEPFAVDGPSIWWPDDRAWCVATEIDLDSTYVGASAECIAAILEDDRLEAFEAHIEDRVDIGADTINPPPEVRG
jgi:hypothetical protein